MLNFVFESLTIDSCRDIITSIKVISFCKKIYKIVRAYNLTIVFSYLSIIVSIRLKDKCKTQLSNNRDFMFILIKLFDCFESNSNVLNYITNTNIYAI